MKNCTIPIFFSSDDNYIPFLAVAITSLVNNASKEYKYDITVYTIFGVGVNKKDFPSDVKFKCVFKRLFRGANSLMKMISPLM